MTESEIIDDLLQRERGWRNQVTRPDGTVDPATNHGITLPVLQNWRLIFYQQVVTTEGDLAQLSVTEARRIYNVRYIDQPGFTPANIPFEPLRVQLIDFGVNSGPERAVRWLQRVLRLQPTGTLNAQTINLIGDLCRMSSPSWTLLPIQLLNDALVAARSYMIDQAVDHGTMRKADEEGVESRALSFFLARPAP